MSRRGKRILKALAALYLLAVVALLASIPFGRARRTRPELVRTEVTVPRREHFTQTWRGWRAEARFEEAKREFVRAGYILRTPVKEAGGPALEVGRVLGAEEVASLAEAGVAKVYVFDPRLVRGLAAQKLEAGEEIKDAHGVPIVRVGDELTEDRLIAMALTYDEAPEGERRERLSVRGSGSLMGFDLTLVFTGLNFLALVALLYAFLWDPVTRLLDDRARAVREDIETARTRRDEAESLKTGLETEMAEIRRDARRMREEGRAQGEKEKARLLEGGREEARRLMERAERAMAAEAEEGRKQLASEFAGLSVELAAKMLEREVSPADHERLTDEFVRSLEKGAGPADPNARPADSAGNGGA